MSDETPKPTQAQQLAGHAEALKELHRRVTQLEEGMTLMYESLKAAGYDPMFTLSADAKERAATKAKELASGDFRV